MKKLLLLAILSIACTTQASAEKISEQKAREIAQGFFSGRNISSGIPSRSTGALQLAHNSTGYYVYTRGEANGYVIVAADNAYFSNEIIGYSDSGTFDPSNMPDGMRWWLDECDHSLKYAKSRSITTRAVAAQSAYAEISPLLSCKWGQDAPYNGRCPLIDGKQAPTGCVATALSQIIYHNRFPSTGYNGNIYDYAAMTNTYSAGSTQTAKDAVAQLMHDVGLACNMNYGASVSGALNIDGARAMVDHFGYDKSTILLSRDFYSDDEWVDMLYGSLAAGAPVFYAGLNGSVGHAFVCDGYQNGYFHFNWGWEGISDGYFLIDALNPKDQGTGGSDSGYNLQQEAIFNLKPAENASDYTTLMYCYSDFDITSKSHTVASTATFTGSFLNYSLVPKNITLGLKVADSTGTATWLDGGDYTATLNTYAGPNQFSIPLSAFPTAEGRYSVYPAYRDNSTDTWHEMRVNTTLSKTYLTATVADGRINFANSSATGKPQLDFSNWTQTPAPGVAGKNCSVSVSITNNGADFADEIKLLMNSYTTGQTGATSSPVAINITSGSTETVTFSLTAPASPDMYKCLVIDSNGEQLNPVPPYHNIIENTEKDEPALSLSEVYIENENNVSITNPKIIIKVTCESGSYNGQVKMTVTQGTKTICYKTKNIAFASSGLTKSLEYSGTAFFGLQEGKTYTVNFTYYLDGNWIQLGEPRTFTTELATGIDSASGTDASAENSIYNLLGVKLLHFEAGEAIDTSSLAKGIYIVVSGNSARRIIVSE